MSQRTTLLPIFNAAISTIRLKLYDFRNNIYYFSNNIYCTTIYIPATIYIVTAPQFQKNKKQHCDFVNSFKVVRLQKLYILLQQQYILYDNIYTSNNIYFNNAAISTIRAQENKADKNNGEAN